MNKEKDYKEEIFTKKAMVIILTIFTILILVLNLISTLFFY